LNGVLIGSGYSQGQNHIDAKIMNHCK